MTEKPDTGLSLFAWVTDRVILGATRHPIPAEGKSRRVLTLPGVGQLEIWVSRVGPDNDEGPDVYVLKFPGTASRAEDSTDALAQWWPERCVEIWSVNPPGYGSSSGRASLRNFPSMSRTALEALRSEADGIPVVLYGESLGCVSSLHLAARHPVDAVLLRDPPPLRETVRSRYETGIMGWFAGLLAQHIPEELDTIENASKAAAPAVMVLSQLDRVVPFNLQRRVAEAYCGPRQSLVLTEADHGDQPSPVELGKFKDLTGWLWAAIEQEQQ